MAASSGFGSAADFSMLELGVQECSTQTTSSKRNLFRTLAIKVTWCKATAHASEWQSLSEECGTHPQSSPLVATLGFQETSVHAVSELFFSKNSSGFQGFPPSVPQLVTRMNLWSSGRFCANTPLSSSNWTLTTSSPAQAEQLQEFCPRLIFSLLLCPCDHPCRCRS